MSCENLRHPRTTQLRHADIPNTIPRPTHAHRRMAHFLRFCKSVIRHDFGESVEKIVDALISHGYCPRSTLNPSTHPSPCNRNKHERSARDTPHIISERIWFADITLWRQYTPQHHQAPPSRPNHDPHQLVAGTSQERYPSDKSVLRKFFCVIDNIIRCNGYNLGLIILTTHNIVIIRVASTPPTPEPRSRRATKPSQTR